VTSSQVKRLRYTSHFLYVISCLTKLFLYSKLKTDIKLEDYLKLTKKINNRQLLTKFRTSDHPLEIELGRKFPDIKDSVKLVKYEQHKEMSYIHS
jgi:hypothetical protein